MDDKAAGKAFRRAKREYQDENQVVSIKDANVTAWLFKLNTNCHKGNSSFLYTVLLERTHRARGLHINRAWIGAHRAHCELREPSLVMQELTMRSVSSKQTRAFNVAWLYMY
jgi:hypothetical protein